MSDQSLSPIPQEEISLREIIDFFVENWRVIILAGVFGMLGAAVFSWLAPNQYKATAQIKMAQIGFDPLQPSNIEDPNALLARMKMPSTYDTNSISMCGQNDEKNSAELISKNVKIIIPKGTTKIIELEVHGGNPERAIGCAQVIYEGIKKTQSAMALTIIEEAKSKITKYNDRLQSAQTYIANLDGSASYFSGAYLLTRDEIKLLKDEIFRLNDLIVSAGTRQTELVSPIYASQQKFSPSRSMSLLMGFMAGLLAGIFLIIGNRTYRAYKASILR